MTFYYLLFLLLVTFLVIGGGFLYKVFYSFRKLDTNFIVEKFGSTLGRHISGNKPEAPLNALPAHLIILLLLREDQGFFTHRGTNWPETRRAIRDTFFHIGSKKRGGSSITEQFIGSIFLEYHFFLRHRLIKRVLKLLLARYIEYLYGKETVLSLYLNSLFLTQNSRGIFEASLFFFGKMPQQLTIAESDILIWLVPNPIKRAAKLKQFGSSAYDFKESYNNILHLFRFLEKIKSHLSALEFEQIRYPEVRQYLRSEFFNINNIESEELCICQTALTLEEIAKIIDERMVFIRPNPAFIPGTICYLSGDLRVLLLLIMTRFRVTGYEYFLPAFTHICELYSDEVILHFRKHKLLPIVNQELIATLPNSLRVPLLALVMKAQCIRPLQAAAFSELVMRFENCQVPLLVVKGFDTETRLYPEGEGMRYGDIDVIVSEVNFKGSCKILFELGYHPSVDVSNKAAFRIALTQGEGITWLRNQDNISVDLHIFGKDAFDKLLGGSLRNTWKSGSQVVSYSALSDEDLLLYLCAHAKKHLYFRLILLIDIFLLTERIGKSRTLNLAHNQVRHGFKLDILAALVLIDDHFLTNYQSKFELTTYQAKLLYALINKELSPFIYGQRNHPFQSVINRFTRSSFYSRRRDRLRYLLGSIFRPTFSDLTGKSKFITLGRIYRLLKANL